MTSEQLNLLGQPDQPDDLELGPVQRAAMRTLRELGSLSRHEAGQIAHAYRGKHGGADTCMFCGTDGALLLESLIRRGLAEPSVGGDVQLPRPATASEPLRDEEWDGSLPVPYGVIPYA